MIIPVGERYQQNLYRLTKRGGKLQKEPLQATLFVPMTGLAEDSREVLPDPTRPEVRNGGFELAVGQSDQPAGWHYLRQAKVEADDRSPEGQRVLAFANETAGRAAHALQGLAIDGRRVSRIKLACSVRGEALARGLNVGETPALAITFYDQRRAVIGNDQLGPWTGSFDWRQETGEVRVPLAAREAIVRVGLHGATGKLWVDRVTLTAKQPR
jgi:protein-L-isoaspartate(D-aspartate) O-methyltransferase